MFKFVLVFTMLLHGLIHLMGFAKAFDYGNVSQLTKEVTKPMGILWLTTALAFILATVLYLLKRDSWWIAGTVAVFISQVLIVSDWQEAKFGTVANIIILVAAIASWGIYRFENTFEKDVKENLERSGSLSTEILSEKDIQPLPAPVQRYLRYAGVVGKPKTRNVRIVFEGEMRDKGKDWFSFTAEQYNFFNQPARLFFMKAKMFGLKVPGYHRYMDAAATMDIRLFGLFSVIKEAGDVMDKTETVTLFNDMCLMAPAALIDKRIEWAVIDENSVEARFTNQENTISAILYFNEQGQLIDFLSEDRTAMADKKQYPFSTPVSDYKNINERNIMTRGEAVWHYPDGKFIYGKFRLKEIEYNVSRLK